MTRRNLPIYFEECVCDKGFGGSVLSKKTEMQIRFATIIRFYYDNLINLALDKVRETFEHEEEKRQRGSWDSLLEQEGRELSFKYRIRKLLRMFRFKKKEKDKNKSATEKDGGGSTNDQAKVTLTCTADSKKYHILRSPQLRSLNNNNR